MPLLENGNKPFCDEYSHTAHVMCGRKTNVCARIQETLRWCIVCATGNSNSGKTHTILKITHSTSVLGENKTSTVARTYRKPTVVSSMNLSLRRHPYQAYMCVVHSHCTGKILTIITMTELFKSRTTQVLLKTAVMFITVEQHNKLLSITETNTDSRKV